MKQINLKSNGTDTFVSILSSTVSYIPLVGSFASELVQSLIPNQRQDRIVEFVKNIDYELQNMKIDFQELKEKFSNQKYGSFTYNCIRMVTNEVYEEKIKYYKNLLIQTLTDDEKTLVHNERILRILEQLDYYEILYLKFYSDCNIGGTKTMNEVIERLGFQFLQPTYMMSMDNKAFDEETMKQITLNNLCNSGLLNREIKWTNNGKHQHISYKITHLGKLILKKIGE